jgi:hypothetical protein
MELPDPASPHLKTEIQKMTQLTPAAVHPAQPRPSEKLENFLSRVTVHNLTFGRTFKDGLHEDWIEAQNYPAV